MRQVVIFTDLDGTLLDAESYSFEPALPALQKVRDKNIPLLFVSSKTRTELEVWRRRLENRHPFISENGGGIFIPEDYFPFPVEGGRLAGYRVISLGTPYAVIRQRFAALRERLGIRVKGFGDMTEEEIAGVTGLPPSDARCAKQRDYGEPFLFEEGTDERFMQAIEQEGLRWTQGRFFHLMGDHHKGRAIMILKEMFLRHRGAVTAIGLGNSLNDLPLLLAVDRPVLVKDRSGRHDSRIAVPGLRRTRGIGPDGWNEAILELLA